MTLNHLSVRILQFSLLLGLLLSSSVFAAQSATSTSNCQTLEVYSKKGCPHCARAFAWLQENKSHYPGLSVVKRDVALEHHLSAFRKLNEARQISRPGVPTFHFCEKVWVGFDPQTMQQMLQSTRPDSVKVSTSSDKSKQNIVIPVIGEINMESVGLPLFTLVIGLVDGFNPCAMWVLMFLLSLLINIKSRKRVALIAGIFVLVSGLVYFAFMAAWLNLYLIIGWSRVMQVVVACLALLVGAVHIKDFFMLKKGISFSLPESQKGNIYARLRGIVQAENLLLAIIAVTLLAIVVNFLELLCTAGLPALYTQILALQELTSYKYYGYLALYNLAYIFDDGLMVGVVVFTMTRRKMTEIQGRGLKLLSGAVVFILGLLLLFAPDMLF